MRDLTLFLLRAFGWWILTGQLYQVIRRARMTREQALKGGLLKWYVESVATAVWVTAGVSLVTLQ